MIGLLLIVGVAIAGPSAEAAPSAPDGVAVVGDAERAELAAGHPLLPTLADWAERSVDAYTLEGRRPYRSTVALVDRDSWYVEASLGAVVVDQGWRTRPGRAELVVGDPKLDSSRFQQRSGEAIARPRFVVDDVPLAVSRDLWLATDDSFKKAVRRHEVKRAALARVGGAYPPDWSPADPVVALAPSDAPASLDVERLRSIAVDGSARLRDLGGLRMAEVKTSASVGTYVLATSEGTRLVQPENEAVVYAWADVLRDDGVQVYEYKQWVGDSVADLPPTETLLAEIEAMGRRVLARRDAEVVTYYEGPVVFEGDAAADLYRYLAIPEVLGTPPEPQAGRTYEQLVRDQARIGRRLLPEGWSLVDDPTEGEGTLAGTYRYDREGVPAQRVELVDDGVVRDLLMSRVPRHDRDRSNGHARGDVQGQWVARESIVTVTPERMASDRRFERELARSMRQAGVDRVLVVRGLERGRGRALPEPTDAVWRYADGREEPALKLDFTYDDRRILRDVIAAGGGAYTRAYLAPNEADRVAQGYSGLPAAVIAPRRVLVSQLEAVFPGGSVEPPVLGPPPR